VVRKAAESMFGPGVDWKQPQTGGLLSQLIVKEEAALSQPKPRVVLKHVWNPEDLKDRPSSWSSVRPRSGPTGTIQLADRRTEGNHRCRSEWLHQRRMHDNLAASRLAGAAGHMTPELYVQLHPTYAMNDTFATATTSALIGMGSHSVTLKTPTYARDRNCSADLATLSRNGSNREQVEAGLKELAATKQRPVTSTLRERKQLRAREQARPPPAYARSSKSTFCARPGEQPLD